MADLLPISNDGILNLFNVKLMSGDGLTARKRIDKSHFQEVCLQLTGLLAQY